MIHDELRKRVLLKTGLDHITSRDCEQIANGINQSLNRHISVTTLKRVFGFAKKQHSFSKYTLATLMDYANADELILPDHKPETFAPARPDNIKILSFLAENEPYAEAFNGQECLNPKQLVLEALEILQKQNLEFLPLADRGKCIGMVYGKDLVYFLGCDDQMYGTLYHKFNFDLYTAIAILRRS
ncbi:DUF294 nucleotidyltransferase-like/CBS domain-containing protein [Pedobacter africanus]|uniref:CBS domain-containing protein n=1 Tax=Pedobacter africanus TaxID=151894 RepID=A0A1W2EIP1_9SPHI|nr:CBS domain-containing protein [Pedobacter africanus]SMD09038.1 hypothetical protein SAMN04488524_4813 [Pedobacter africanus]